jgi:hypothetical protein
MEPMLAWANWRFLMGETALFLLKNTQAKQRARQA